MAAVRLYRVTSEPDFHTGQSMVVYQAAIDFEDLARHKPGFPGAADIAQVELLGELILPDHLS